MATNLYIENTEPSVKQGRGLKTKLPVTLSGTGATLTVAGTTTLPADTTIGGSSVSALGVITSTSANALTVGPSGATNPSFNVDASTASAATGLNIKSAAAASGLAVSVLSSGTDENLTVNAKGSGTITLNNTATGNIVLGRAATGVSLSVTGAVTSRSGTAVAAAASVTPAFLTSSTALLGLYFGTGSPNTALTAAKGSLYMRTDGSTTNDRAYVNTDGSTAWTAVTTAA